MFKCQKNNNMETIEQTLYVRFILEFSEKKINILQQTLVSLADSFYTYSTVISRQHELHKTIMFLVHLMKTIVGTPSTLPSA